MRDGVGTKSGVDFADGGQSHLHLSHAPGSATGSSGKLSQVRHDAGAENCVRGRGGKSRTHRHDVAVFGWRGACPATFPARDGACISLATPRKLGDGGHHTLDSIRSLNSPGVVGPLAPLSSRFALTFLT